MQRFTATLMAIGLVIFVSPSGVSAQDGYNSDNSTATVSDATPPAGGSFSVSVDNCAGGSSTVTFDGGTKTADTNQAGTATTSLTAPATAGTYTGTVSCGTTVSSFSVVVAATPTPTVTPSGSLPATGGSGSGTAMMIASVLLLAGVGMFGVSHLRRRQFVG